MGDWTGVQVRLVSIWFSGAKGFHVSVPRVIFGNPSGSDVLHVFRHCARRLVRGGFNHIDTGIYQPARVLRLPNSVHSKTSLYKYPLEYAELADSPLEHIAELARGPRADASMAIPASEAPKAMHWWDQASQWCAERRNNPRSPNGLGVLRGDGWQFPPCVRQAERATLADGTRHQTFLTLARFYALIGMAPQEIATRLGEIDARHPIRDPDYIERLAATARSYRGFRGCPNEVLRDLCEPSRCVLSRD